jgi:hypothetical protein
MRSHIWHNFKKDTKKLGGRIKMQWREVFEWWWGEVGEKRDE